MKRASRRPARTVAGPAAATRPKGWPATAHHDSRADGAAPGSGRQATTRRAACPRAVSRRGRRRLFEEAIRPHVTGWFHVTGRFEDMLLAVMRHSAMLMYLDNAGSVGWQPCRPAQPSWTQREPGERVPEIAHGEPCRRLNPSGCHQLRQAADRLVGRSGGGSARLPLPANGLRARSAAVHGPGVSRRRGRRDAALHFLAGHTSTHRFLATKLVRHFVADDPPADAFRKIEGVLQRSRRAG